MHQAETEILTLTFLKFLSVWEATKRAEPYVNKDWQTQLINNKNLIRWKHSFLGKHILIASNLKYLNQPWY